ncbi:hypothetical protein HanRHA438_Chr17g0819491 [Helianthus annuus]|nr:hypothetical protein HanIR_Chr17g0878511 [Helianthus annuus]KAJ0826896.1 hypothetical protein HanRHA438_Chr17g0819491 [Helianthus annuus]
MFKTPRHEQCLQIKHYDLNHSQFYPIVLKHHAMNLITVLFMIMYDEYVTKDLLQLR